MGMENLIKNLKTKDKIRLDAEPTIIESEAVMNETELEELEDFIGLEHPKKVVYPSSNDCTVFGKGCRWYYTKQSYGIICEKFYEKTQKSEWFLYPFKLSCLNMEQLTALLTVRGFQVKKGINYTVFEYYGDAFDIIFSLNKPSDLEKVQNLLK